MTCRSFRRRPAAIFSQGRDLLHRRTDPGDRGRYDETTAADAIEADQDRFRATAACGRPARQPVSRRSQRAVRRQCRGRPDQAADGQVAGRRFRRRRQQDADGQACRGRGPTAISMPAFKEGQADRSRKTSSPRAIRINSMEPRTALAYWQGGKCFLYGSNQSHTAAIANISRYIGIKPKELVFIAEYCGGGFGSKIPGYPIMAIPALMSKKLEPSGDDAHLPHRGVWHRQRASRLPGSRQDGLRAKMARCSPPIFTSCRRAVRTSAAAISAPRAMRCRWSISRPRCASARYRC